MAAGEDTVAVWSVPLEEKIHRIQFQHGTTTGKRVILIDGQEVVRRDWMFKLVGKEHFRLGKLPCTITIDALGTFAYEYSLEVNGKAFEKFREEQSRKLQTWTVTLGGADSRICLDKQSMDIWVNGSKIETAGEFGDTTETHFVVAGVSCKLASVNSGRRSLGVVHELHVGGQRIGLSQEHSDLSHP